MERMRRETRLLREPAHAEHSLGNAYEKQGVGYIEPQTCDDGIDKRRPDESDFKKKKEKKKKALRN
jgi:hypothetical protein